MLLVLNYKNLSLRKNRIKTHLSLSLPHSGEIKLPLFQGWCSGKSRVWGQAARTKDPTASKLAFGIGICKCKLPICAYIYPYPYYNWFRVVFRHLHQAFPRAVSGCQGAALRHSCFLLPSQQSQALRFSQCVSLCWICDRFNIFNLTTANSFYLLSMPALHEILIRSSHDFAWCWVSGP